MSVVTRYEKEKLEPVGELQLFAYIRKVTPKSSIDVSLENREIAHDISISGPCICPINFSIMRLTQGRQFQKRGRPMNTAQRLHLIRIITRIDNNPDFSKKIGVKNTSIFKPEKNNSKKVADGK